MSNNCCDTEIYDSGTLITPIIVSPTITGGSWTNGTLTGGVTLDEPTATSIATQICDKLGPCIQNYVDDGTFTNVTINSATLPTPVLSNAKINGTTTLDTAAINSIVDALCPSLAECILGHVNGATLENITLNNSELNAAVINGLTINGTIALSNDARDLLASKLVDALKPLLEPWIQTLIDNSINYPVTSVNGETGAVVLTADDVGAIAAAGGSGSDISLSDSTFTNPTLTGGTTNATIHNTATLAGVTTISGDIAASDTATAALCRIVTPCMTSVITDIVDDVVAEVVTPEAIAGVFTDCEGLPRVPNTPVPSCADLANAINTAILALPPSDIVKGLTYDVASYKLRLDTELSNGTPQFWEVDLSSLSTGGGATTVIADGVTIEGNGSNADKLRLIMVSADAPALSTGTELPTSIYGGRMALLGDPDDWIVINGKKIPAWNVE